jgi:hypothetical protein
VRHISLAKIFCVIDLLFEVFGLTKICSVSDK